MMFCLEEFQAVRDILSDEWKSEIEVEHWTDLIKLKCIYSSEEISFHLFF